MQTQLLFYKNAVPVSASKHKDTSLRSDGTYAYAAEVNSVPLVAAEFRAAASDCCVVFAGEGNDIIPVVILGFRDRENLYVDEGGHWTGRYVPAFMRRYPFVFGQAEDADNFTLYVDEDFDGLNKNGEGERLFDSRGERTAYLNQILDFMREYQAQFVRTRAFCKAIADLDLLEPMQAQYTMPDGSPGRLSGFSAINRDKLKALTGEPLERMLRNDELELLYIHLQSLNNLQPLLAKAAGDVAPGPEADTPVEDAANKTKKKKK